MIHTADLFSSRWVYAQFIALDANFKLKLKNRQINDPELDSGCSYFVENSAYVDYIANNPRKDEKDVRCILSTRETALTLVLGHELRHRIPCSKPSELTRWQ